MGYQQNGTSGLDISRTFVMIEDFNNKNQLIFTIPG